MKKLASHQRYAVAVMHSVDGLGIFYDAGCGKTMCALTWLYEAMMKGEMTGALIICPAGLVGTWEYALDHVTEFEGFDEEGKELLKSLVEIRSFQKIYHSERRLYYTKKGKEKYKRIVELREDVDRYWDAVIIDESHCIGAHDSVQTQACHLLAKLSKRRYIMTGTPVSGGGGKEDFQKLFGQIQFLEPGKWSSWTAWKEEYVLREDRWYKPSMYDVEKCRALMNEYGISARLRDCFDMPPETHSTVPCEIACRAVYKDLREKKVLKYKVDLRTAGGMWAKLRQVCSGFLLNTEGVMEIQCAKDIALGDLLDGTDEPVVIFCFYTHSIDKVEGIARKHGRNPVVYDGRSKDESWREFQFGDKDTVIVQYNAGSAGLDLFKGTKTIYYEPTLSSLALEQSMARTMRKGQTKHCTYYYLSTPHTVESEIWDSVRNGVSVTREMMDEWAREGRI